MGTPDAVALLASAVAGAAILVACGQQDAPRAEADAASPGPGRTSPAPPQPPPAPPAPGVRGPAPGSAEVGAPPPPVQRPAAPAVDLSTIAKVSEQIEAARRWKTAVTAPTRQFLDDVLPRFNEWAGVLAQMSAAGQREQADQLCDAIVALRNHWGPEIFPPDRFNAFARDRFWVAGKRVEAAQFFEPVPFYPDDDRITKLYRLSVYDGDRVVRRYYLEHSALNGQTFYVLGRSDVATGRHVQVQPYGATRPSYWTLMERTILDLGGAQPPSGPSSGRR